MGMRYSLSILILCFALNGLCRAQDQTVLVITVENVRTSKGVIRAGLYKNPDNFTDDPFYSFSIPKDSLEENTIIYHLTAITPGIFAISMLDDNNSNSKMDYTIFGMPQEGFGFSNNAKPKMLKGPDFESCSFTVRQGTNAISVRMQYF